MADELAKVERLAREVVLRKGDWTISPDELGALLAEYDRMRTELEGLRAERRSLRGKVDRMIVGSDRNYAELGRLRAELLAEKREHLRTIEDAQRIKAEFDRRGEVEQAAAAYMLSCLCNGGTDSPELNADINAKFAVLLDAVRTNGDFRG